MTVCALCGEPIDPTDDRVWQATSCFTATRRTRSSGRQVGKSDRVVYRYLDKWAHDLCVQRLKAGRLGQAMLAFDDA